MLQKTYKCEGQIQGHLDQIWRKLHNLIFILETLVEVSIYLCDPMFFILLW